MKKLHKKLAITALCLATYFPSFAQVHFGGGGGFNQNHTFVLGESISHPQKLGVLSGMSINRVLSDRPVQGPPFSPIITPEAARLVGVIELDDLPVSAGDQILAIDVNSDEVVGANPVIINAGIAYMNLTVYSNSGNYQLYLYDQSEDKFIKYEQEFNDWINRNGGLLTNHANFQRIYPFRSTKRSEIPLVAGFNFIGFDTYLADSSLQVVLQGIFPNLIEATGLYPGLGSVLYNTSLPPFLNSLQYAYPGKHWGLVINMATADTLRFEGLPLDETQKAKLEAGWGLVSIGNNESTLVEEYYRGVLVNNSSCVL